MFKYVIPIGSGLIVASVIVSLTNTVGLFIPIATLTAIIVYAIYWMIERIVIEYKSIRIGEAVPNISWTSISGEMIDLQKFLGRWVLLCYWCPCPRHRVDILAIKSFYHDKLHEQFKVLIIDSPDTFKSNMTLQEFAHENSLAVDFCLISDVHSSLDNTIFDKFDLGMSRPKYFLINPEGILHRCRENAFSSEIFTYNVSRDDISDLDEKKTLSNVDEFMSDVYYSQSK